MSKKQQTNPLAWRLHVVTGMVALAMGALVWRMADLHINDREFLQDQGDARYLRVVTVPAHRGMISDRNGEPLAISTPVESVWANPKELLGAREQWPQLARLLGYSSDRLQRLLAQRQDREFVYLRRHLNPDRAAEVAALNVPGVALLREYQRYYPSGEVSAHVVGFTNIDDEGQEGMELLYGGQLRGIPGSKRVIKDRLGRIVENVESIATARPGEDIRLSLDLRIQYLAYRELKAAVQRHKARSGSVVVLDALSGEVLAMVNQPSYNPNNRKDLDSGRYRNRAVTDVFEPGSTVKPFTIATALDSGRYRPDTIVDTSPGTLRMAGYTIRDSRNYGSIDLSTIIQKSSNVGASRIALSMEPKSLWNTYTGVGFGYDTGSGFPGESGGLLNHYSQWREVEQATLSYGYGLSVTPLQLAHAYSVLAGDGRLRPVSFLALEGEEPRQTGMPALSAKTVKAVREMLQRVVEPGGTAVRAAVPGYRVAGKTGTVRKAAAGGYDEDRYLAVFAGMAPASRPRLVMAVIIDEPTAGEYYGGTVAGPVFSNVMAGAMRLLDIAPDDLQSLDMRVAILGGDL